MQLMLRANYALVLQLPSFNFILNLLMLGIPKKCCVWVFEGSTRIHAVASCSNMYHDHNFLLFLQCLVNQFSLLMHRILSTSRVIFAD